MIILTITETLKDSSKKFYNMDQTINQLMTNLSSSRDYSVNGLTSVVTIRFDTIQQYTTFVNNTSIQLFNADRSIKSASDGNRLVVEVNETN